jgi:hypothetical protein
MQPSRQCVQCQREHLAASWYVLRVRDIPSGEPKAHYLCEEGHSHPSVSERLGWELWRAEH